MDDGFALYILPGGEVRWLHSDPAAKFAAGLGGVMNTRRASAIEIGPGNCWYADLAPAGGPVLGPFPLECRAEALRAEEAWLAANHLGKITSDDPDEIPLPPLRQHE